MSTILQQNEFFFKPRARIIKTIGEDLISNDNTAVLELVKNSYDANSEIVVITFEGKLTEKIEGNKKKNVIVKENSSLVIFDQGCGMDFSTIENAWMEPATNFKKINSNHKRKFVGEKGIGRFAVAKLANRLELVTRKENQNEIVVTFDWDQFSDEDAYLDNIKIKWQIRKPEEIKKSGTILKLHGLKNDWDEEKIRGLRVSLSRLLNPIGPSENFLIELNLPKNMDQSLAGIIEKPGTLNRPDYYIKGHIDTNGQPQKVVYFSRSIGKEEPIRVPLWPMCYMVIINKLLFQLNNGSKIPLTVTLGLSYLLLNRVLKQKLKNMAHLSRTGTFKLITVLKQAATKHL